MPNHITNVVESAPEVIASLMIDGRPDFNAVVRAPEILNDFQPHCGVISRAKAALGIEDIPKEPDFMRGISLSNLLQTCTTEVKEKDIPELIRAIQCYQETGYTYWFDWNCANWGTKWNAYDSDSKRCNNTTAHFQTAWSYPRQIAKALSEMHPHDRIIWRFADEDTGSNCGTVEYLGGIVVNENVAPRYDKQSPSEKIEWRKFAISLTDPDTPLEELGINENYEYIEED
jgi:hypothetical protein